MSSDDSLTIILGGGISGLACAHYLEGPSVVLEGSGHLGGLCRSFTKDGFTYDIGGHIMFSKNEGVLKEMTGWLGDNVHQRRRLNDIWYKDRFVKYPFENGLAVLEKEEIFEILVSFLKREEGPAGNLEEWCYRRFGSGLAEKYLLPYNRKIWKREPRDMSVHWVERVPSPPMEDLLKSAIGIETEGYTFQLNFFYPKEGGYESVIRGLAREVERVERGFRVERIEKVGDEWHVSDGTRTIEGTDLISTIPIFDLLSCLQNVPETVKAAVDGLVYNSLIVTMLGVNHEGLRGKTATYFPDPEVLPHRVCYMRGFSERNAPEGCSSVLCETTVRPGNVLLDEDGDGITERIGHQIKDVCGFSMNEVISTELRRVKYAYPVYDGDYQKNTGIFYDYLDSLGINFTGRFAAFTYINSDKCVEFAKGVAEALNAGVRPERAWSHL